MLQPRSHLYSRWLGRAFGEHAIPTESRATCDTCAMCQPGSGFTPDAEDSDFRFVLNGCCTYYPELPNFLVGQVLAPSPGSPVTDETGQALGVIRTRIQQRTDCTPFGIRPPTAVDEAYSDPFHNVFGSDESFRCPFQRKTDMACTIWGQRNSVCSTWFCRFEHGRFSAEAWEAVKALLRESEEALSLWCVNQLLDEDSLARLVDDAGKPRTDVLRRLSGGLEDEGVIPDSVARRVWGRWFGREEDFFRACAERVAALDWPDVRAVAGPRLEVLERLASRALGKLRPSSVPDRLRHAGTAGARFLIRPGDDGQTAVHLNDVHFDVQFFDTKLLNELPVFDGVSPTPDVQAQLHGRGVDLSGDTVRRLLDYGLLEPAGSEPAASVRQGPVQPDDRLRMIPSDYSGHVDVNESGATIVKFISGYKTVEFDEPDLIEFGRQLMKRRWGFAASRCTAWHRGDTPLPWDRVAPLLDTLLAEGVLERVPPME